MTPEQLDDLLKQFQKNGPASPIAVDAVEPESSVRLPVEYREFLLLANGGEGFIGSGSYAMLWRVEELLRFNTEYQVDEYAPGLLLFGSSGGGEAFAFDLRREEGQPVVSVPFVGMDLNEALPLADTFGGFWSILGTSRGQIPHTKRSDRDIQDRRGLEIFEIQPIILGGSPTDPANKTLLTRQQHIGAVRYWNEIVRDVRRDGK